MAFKPVWSERRVKPCVITTRFDPEGWPSSLTLKPALRPNPKVWPWAYPQSPIVMSDLETHGYGVLHVVQIVIKMRKWYGSGGPRRYSVRQYHIIFVSDEILNFRRLFVQLQRKRKVGGRVLQLQLIEVIRMGIF